MRPCVLVVLAVLAFAPSRARAQPAAMPDPMDEPVLTTGCAAGGFAGGYAARAFVPLILTVGGALFIGGTILAGCVAGALAGSLTDLRPPASP